VKGTKVNGRQNGYSNEVAQGDIASAWESAEVCQELGIMLQKGKTRNGLQKALQVIGL
jgi:hypothetical protein